MNKHKYKANCFYYEPTSDTRLPLGVKPLKGDRASYWYFASGLEWEVFTILKQYFPVSSIQKDISIEILRGTLIETCQVSVIYRCDFRITIPNTRHFLYIECKGLMTETASLKMKMLVANKPSIAHNLIMVLRVKRGISKLPLIRYQTIKEFKDHLGALTE